MVRDLQGKDTVVAVVGTGTMGRGIAQVCAQAGVQTLLYDSRDGAVTEATQAIGRALEGLVAKGRLTADVAKGTVARLRPVGSLDEIASASLVIEAIIEEIDAKRELFHELEKRLSEDAVIATNTSSLSVTAMAAACRRSERVVGFHFFNPPPLMRLVEVIGGLQTAPEVVDAMVTFARRIGKHPVVAADSPGFIVNHAGRAYVPEALRIVAHGVASPQDVDLVMKEAARFRMGPFELLDLVGADVAHAVMESIHGQYFGEPMYQPSAQLAVRVAGGLLGRKTKRGYYSYDGAGSDTKSRPEPMASGRQVPASAWLPDEPGVDPLAETLKSAGCAVKVGGQPDGRALCFVTPLGFDASSTIARLGLDPARTIAVDMITGLTGRRTVMKNPLVSSEAVEEAVAVLSADGTPVTVIRDAPGFVAQRLLAMIVNVGCRIAELRIAQPNDIDTAVELGLSYPKGPLALGDQLGVRRVLAILDGMHEVTGDPKYRAATWLRQRAVLGASLSTPD